MFDTITVSFIFFWILFFTSSMGPFMGLIRSMQIRQKFALFHFNQWFVDAGALFLLSIDEHEAFYGRKLL